MLSIDIFITDLPTAW